MSTGLCCGCETKKFGSFRNRNGIVQRHRCLTCAKTFSISPYDGLRIEKAKLIQIVKLLAEGLGVRGTARVTSCDPATVLNVLQIIGQKCLTFHDKFARNIKTDSLQLDELWARVRCSQRKATLQGIGDEFGDIYSYLAIAAREKFIVSFHNGKRDIENTDTFVGDLAKRIDGTVQITSDSFRPYQPIVRKHLLGRLHFATMQKLYEAPFNPKSEAVRRYSPARFTGVKIRVQAGAPRPDRICTSHVERQNLSVRHFCKRFARLGLGYSRTLENHRCAIALFVCAHNWTKIHSTMACTPAVALKLATETWTVERLIDELATI